MTGAHVSRAAGPPQRIWTFRYVCLGASIFVAYANQTALGPVIPLYVSHMGGSELLAGLVLGGFSLASFALRPAIGRLVDEWDAGKVLLLGCIVLAVATLGLIPSLLWVVFAANVVRGVAWAGVNTGGNSLLALLAPAARRGEASGYYSLFQSAAATVGPAAALYWLGRGGGFTAVFVFCAILAGVGLVVGRPLRTVAAREHRARASTRPYRGNAPLIARSALLPSVLLVFVMVTQPAVQGFLPLYAVEAGVSSTAITAFYVVSGVAAVLARTLLGRVADRASRGVAVVVGLLMMGVALLALIEVTLVPVLLSAAALYSLGQGMALPALTALAIDRADPANLGVAMATYSAAFQIGMGVGGVVSGALITAAGYAVLYMAMAGAIVFGCLLTWWRWSDLSSPSEGR